MTRVRYDPWLPELQWDPYPHYAALRAAEPVHWSELAQAWVLSGYAEVTTALRDPRLSSAARLTYALRLLPESARDPLLPLITIVGRTPGHKDPPAHARVRHVLQQAFRRQFVEALRPRFQAAVDGLLARFLPYGRLDAVQDFAYPLPLLAGALLLGLPYEDVPQLLDWADGFTLVASTQGLFDPAARERASEAVAALLRYCATVIARERTHPDGGALCAMVAAAEQTGVDDDELAAACLAVVVGGHENLRHLLTLGLVLLLQHPAQFAALRDDPGRWDAAIEELLRFDGVGQILWRVAVADVSAGRFTIRAGQRVLLLLAAANRDPARFADADTLHFGRRGGRAIGFGAGPHACPGGGLSRLVAKIAFTALLDRLPNLRLAAEPDWLPYKSTRGLASLPLLFDLPATCASTGQVHDRRYDGGAQ